MTVSDTEIAERLYQAAAKALESDDGAVEERLALVRRQDPRLAAELEACLTIRHAALLKAAFLEGMRYGLAMAPEKAGTTSNGPALSLSKGWLPRLRKRRK
jgi:hypothetical protein